MTVNGKTSSMVTMYIGLIVALYTAKIMTTNKNCLKCLMYSTGSSSFLEKNVTNRTREVQIIANLTMLLDAPRSRYTNAIPVVNGTKFNDGCWTRKVKIESTFVPFQTVQETLQGMKNPAGLANFSNSIFDIDRIYYINLDTNPCRRSFMEGWLSQQPIPFLRVPGIIGREGLCTKSRSAPARCRGVSGLAQTDVSIIDNYNTTGITLVLEDDFKVVEFEKLLTAVSLVPKDWDIIRFDCWGRHPSTLERMKNFTFRTAHRKPCNRTKEQCEFCGGTHAMLWRGDRIQNIRKIWSKQPYSDIDCRLTNSDIHSYCVNIGIGEFHVFSSERTNIPVGKNAQR